MVLSWLGEQERPQACGQLHRGAGMTICMIGNEDHHGKDEKIISRNSEFCGGRCPWARFVAAKTAGATIRDSRRADSFTGRGSDHLHFRD